jgi:hypothetical protein
MTTNFSLNPKGNPAWRKSLPKNRKPTLLGNITTGMEKLKVRMNTASTGATIGYVGQVPKEDIALHAMHECPVSGYEQDTNRNENKNDGYPPTLELDGTTQQTS